ncbi:hypothetical protein FB567DRAFT_79761 [Paraphoma chrysanthemicola]|uniref:WW domain-containing protein n=1 Tax=Paraphoma chrysanthemicola TaxID=798071 RepID=A0A8K0R364_9PLEO|nr:hypothetical protein FB567DRAFT_79761 [Paraphoma chrysanthemicola]
MGLLGELVSNFTHSGSSGQQQNRPSSSSGSHGPPPVSPPWYAEWDGRDNRWLFVNQQTGERTFTYPGPGFAQQQGSYGGPQGGYGNNQGGYSNQGAYNQGSYNPTNSTYQQQEHEKKQGGNGWKYAAAGVAGVAGGALLMHEGHEIKDDYEEDKYRAEARVDQWGNDISNFPENAAGWTGEQVGRVENFDDRVEQRWDNGVNDVENFPENAARWTGEKVQEVEDIPQDIDNKWDNAVDDVAGFGGRMDQAYDDGRDEQRYDDDNRDDW